MSAQPLNTEISIYRTVRSLRAAHRHESVAALIKRLRPLVMVVPGEEILVKVLARDTAVTDFSPYMGQASPTASRGFPIVIGLTDDTSFATAQGSLTAADFAFQIGSDKFIQNTAAGLTRDLFGDLQALQTGTYAT